jgi:hypothetical protein
MFWKVSLYFLLNVSQEMRNLPKQSRSKLFLPVEDNMLMSVRLIFPNRCDAKTRFEYALLLRDY